MWKDDRRGKTMRSSPNESRSEVLRARYAELLRLREYVEQLKNLLEEKSASEEPLINVITERGSNTNYRTV